VQGAATGKISNINAACDPFATEIYGCLFLSALLATGRVRFFYEITPKWKYELKLGKKLEGSISSVRHIG